MHHCSEQSIVLNSPSNFDNFPSIWMSGIAKYLLIVFMLFTVTNAARLFNFPVPAQGHGTGTPIVIENMAVGTYEIGITIRDDDPPNDDVRFYHINNYVINKSNINHCISVWDVKNDKGIFYMYGYDLDDCMNIQSLSINTQYGGE